VGVLRLCSCVPLVSSYSGPGLSPAAVMLGDGGLPVLVSLAPPTSGKLRESLRSRGGVFRNRREGHTGNEPCLGMWRGSLGRRVQCDRKFRCVLITALQAPILFFKGFLWDFTPRSRGIESTCFSETRIDDFLTSRLV